MTDSLLAQASRLTDEQAVNLRSIIERLKCEASLAEFQRRAWAIVEPKTEYVPSWHIDAICEHLEAVTAGEILRLIINIPPRCEKSLNVDVFWPCWVWATQPHKRWIFTSYVQRLSIRDSLKCRRIIQSQWYRRLWGHVFQLTTDQNVKQRFENDKTGYRISDSVEGSSTGEGGDYVVADDPHNVKETESETKREGVITWWDEVMSTRFTDARTTAFVLVMHRLHERDLAGHVLEQGGYEHLMLPMEYDPKRSCVTVLGPQDPRTEEDELLWPDRFPRDIVEDMKMRLGPYAAAGQLDQLPAPRTGGSFERLWFVDPPHRPILGEHEVPPGCDWVAYWDKAGTAGGGSYTAGVLVAYYRATPMTYIRDVVRGQWAAPERERMIESTSALWASWLGGKTAFRIFVEQEPGSGGKDSVHDTMRRLAGYRVQPDLPGARGSKDVRAEPVATAARPGQMRLIEGDWNEPLLRELEHFGPGARWTDQVDALSGAYSRAAEAPKGRAGIVTR